MRLKVKKNRCRSGATGLPVLFRPVLAAENAEDGLRESSELGVELRGDVSGRAGRNIREEEHWQASGTRRARNGRRRGAVLVIVLVCVAVAALVMVTLARMAAAERKLLESGGEQIQADWLADSALERAAATLAKNPEYRGETWTIPADQIGGLDSAAVKIEVQPVSENDARRLVRVQADYPDDPSHRVRRTKQAVVDLAQGEKK